MNTLSKSLLAAFFVGLLVVLWVWCLPALDGLIQRLVACCGPFAAANNGGAHHASGPVNAASLAGAPIDAPRAATPEKGETATVPLAKAPVRKAANGAQIVSFAALADYEYVMPDPLAKVPDPALANQIPDRVKKYAGQVIGIEGYMLPMKVEGNRVRSFMLSRYAGGCCFGRAAMMNELVIVEMPEPTEYIPHTVVLVSGEFEVGAEQDEYGYVISLYRMKGLTVE